MATVLSVLFCFVATVFGSAIPDPDMSNLGYYSKYSAYWKMDSYPRKIALLTDDLQEEYRAFSLGIIDNVADLINAFRDQNLPVIWSYWARRPNDDFKYSPAMDNFYGPEGMDNEKNGLFIFAENGCDILPEIAPKTPEEEAMAFPSRDLNMFWNFDDKGNSILDEMLKARDIDTIVLTGSWTDECILSTALNAFSRGYDVIIPRDAVATVTAQHNTALDIMAGVCCKVEWTKDVLEYIKSGKWKATDDTTKTEM